MTSEQTKLKSIAISILIAVIFFAISISVFDMKQSLLIGVIAMLVALWTNEALPLGVVSLMPIVLFPMLGILDTSEVAANYSKTIIFLFIGGFMLAIAVEKTGLHRYFSGKLLSYFPNTSTGIIYALAFTSAVLSSILSNTTVTLMLMPVAMFLTENEKLKARFLLATAYGASIGGVLTPIGTPPNLILLGFLEEHNISPVPFGEWMLMMFPVVLSMLGIVPWFLSRGLGGVGVKARTMQSAKLNEEQKRLNWIIITLAILLFVNTFSERLFGFTINEKTLLLAFGLLMFVPGVGFLEWKDTRKLPYEIIMLFGAGFSIAKATVDTNLAMEIARHLSFIETMPLVPMLLVVVFFVIFSTEVTSNTALISIALPIFYEFSKNVGESTGAIMLLSATVAASFAFMLPIATPPNAIVMSSGAIEIKQMAKIGFRINLIGIVIIVVVAVAFWQWMF